MHHGSLHPFLETITWILLGRITEIPCGLNLNTKMRQFYYLHIFHTRQFKLQNKTNLDIEVQVDLEVYVDVDVQVKPEAQGPMRFPPQLKINLK